MHQMEGLTERSRCDHWYPVLLSMTTLVTIAFSAVVSVI